MNDLSDRLEFRWAAPKKAPPEDGPPLLIDSGNDVLLGVFDGMGGSGGRRVIRENGDITTEAAIAAQVVHDSVHSFFRAGSKLRRPSKKPEAIAERLRWQVSSDLNEATQLLDLPPALLKGSLVRGMPTTMAVSYCRQLSDGSLQVHIFWAGDSRIYLLTPKNGLQQLTRDDLSFPGDAFENIYNDSPVSNVVNTTQSFKIHTHSVSVQLPAIVFCATDGCYSYLPSPQSFEFQILESLASCRTKEEWAENLRARVAQVSQDDSSLALMAFGWPDFPTLRKAFLPRRRLMRSTIKHMKSQDERSEEVEERELLYERWTSYKPQYEALMSANLG